jgi:hypothetical protein
MSETPAADTPSPAAANLAPQPPAPEAWLRDCFSGVVDTAVAHYQAERPIDTRKGANPAAPGRTIQAEYYRDGTECDTITDRAQGTVTTKLIMSPAIRDSYGRRTILLSTENPGGGKTYEMRFLPTSDAPSAFYSWSTEAALTEGQGSLAKPIAADTPEFTRAWALGAQFQRNWTRLTENKRPNGSVRTGRVAGRLVGALAAGAVKRLHRR